MPEVEDEGLVLIGLRAENYKRITFVEIAPNPNVNFIGGDNEAGKSSLIDAAAIAIGGADFNPARPVHGDADQSVIVAELGRDGVVELVVRKTKTVDGDWQLTVKNADGMAFSSAQTALDRMYEVIAFEPDNFLAMKGPKQREVMIRLLGIRVDDLEAERKRHYDARTEKNREVTRLANLQKSLAFNEDWPDEEVSSAEILGRIERKRAVATAEQGVANAEAARTAVINSVTDRSANDEDAIETTEAEIWRLQAKLKKQKAELENAKKARLAEILDEDAVVTAAEQAVDAATAAAPAESQDELQGQLEGLEIQNTNARAKVKFRDAEDTHSAVATQSDALTEKINTLDAEKKARIAAANFPIAGLEFDDAGLTLDDIPFDDASQSQRLRVAIGLAAASKPKIRLALFRTASLLDDKRKAELRELSREFRIQILAEVVGDRPDVTILMEEGKAIRGGVEPEEGGGDG